MSIAQEEVANALPIETKKGTTSVSLGTEADIDTQIAVKDEFDENSCVHLSLFLLLKPNFFQIEQL